MILDAGQRGLVWAAIRHELKSQERNLQAFFDSQTTEMAESFLDQVARKLCDAVVRRLAGHVEPKENK